MNLQQLEYIIALNEHRHFGRAAEHCNVSQPTLSTMIQRLEEELGVKIFERTRTSVAPTPVGVRLVAQAGVILRQTAILHEIVSDESDNISGSISIGVLPTIAPYLLPRLSPVLRQRLPNLQISFAEMKTHECIDALNNGHIEMAIIASDGFDGIRTQPLYYEEFFGYVSPQLPLYQSPTIRSSEVDPLSLWLLDEGHCFRDQLMRFCQLRRDSQPLHSYRRGSLETFMRMVERGEGMTFIPELCLEMLSQEHRALVRPFSIPRPSRCITLCCRDDYARAALFSELKQAVLSSVPEPMHRLRTGQHLV